MLLLPQPLLLLLRRATPVHPVLLATEAWLASWLQLLHCQHLPRLSLLHRPLLPRLACC
jgi:hypothetical protein